MKLPMTEHPTIKITLPWADTNQLRTRDPWDDNLTVALSFFTLERTFVWILLLHLNYPLDYHWYNTDLGRTVVATMEQSWEVFGDTHLREPLPLTSTMWMPSACKWNGIQLEKVQIRPSDMSSDDQVTVIIQDVEWSQCFCKLLLVLLILMNHCFCSRYCHIEARVSEQNCRSSCNMPCFLKKISWMFSDWMVCQIYTDTE